MSDSTDKKARKIPLIPQDLMYEFLHALRLNIGGIPHEGYNFHLIKNLRIACREAGRDAAMMERIKNLDLFGEEYIRELLDSIVALDNFVNPK